MNLLIIGATGGTGRSLVEQALAQGHAVTAFVRNPASFTSTALPESFLERGKRSLTTNLGFVTIAPATKFVVSINVAEGSDEKHLDTDLFVRYFNPACRGTVGS